MRLTHLSLFSVIGGLDLYDLQDDSRNRKDGGMKWKQ